MKAVLRIQGPRCPATRAMAANDWLCDRVASSTRPTRIAAAPAWVITAYHWPAVCTSCRYRWSARTSRSDVRAIDSHRKRKAVSYTHLRAHETVLDLVCRLL